jgi:hypothetical protein
MKLIERAINIQFLRGVSNMKHFRVIFTIMTMFIVIMTAESFAQQGKKRMATGGWRADSTFNRMYNLKTVETVAGEITTIDTLIPAKGKSYGVHLMLKTDKEKISVHLGPGWYLAKQDVKIELKDKVEIKGSRIIFEGSPAIIAAEVKKGDSILKLRNESGIPCWSGWQRK